MKLIDLLVKELPQRGGWPDAANYVVQDCDGTVKFSKSINFLHIKAGEWCSNKDGDDWIYGDRPFEGNFIHHTIAHDRNSSIVTRAQYEAALASSEGWIEWHGGKCPIDSDAIVEIKNREPIPCHFNNDRAGDFDWAHTGSDSDIIAYRVLGQRINHRASDEQLEQDLNECIGQGVDVPEWNGEGLPPAGCECEARYRNADKWVFFRCIGVDCGVAFGWLGKEAATLGRGSYEFRPLRTEAEMAREKLAASLHVAAGASPIELNGIGPLYFKLADAIISGSVFGTTFKAGK